MADTTAGPASLQPQREGHGVKDLPARGRAECYGFIDSVTHQPPGPQPFFSALVVDPVQGGTQAGGTSRKPAARLRVIWLGRDRVPGIKAGVEVHLKGMVTEVEGLPAMFNPRYEILSTQEH